MTDIELLAVLFRTGCPGTSVIDLANRVLLAGRDWVGLSSASADSLLQLGLGPARTATLLAGFELSRRLARARLPERQPMTHPSAVASYLALRYASLDQEVMGALFLDNRNGLMSEKELYRGTMNRAAVEPRAILKEGLLRDAAGFVVFHTHPSGDPSPSAEDLAFTRRLDRSAELVGVRLVDHLIVSVGERWVSLRQRGGW